MFFSVNSDEMDSPQQQPRVFHPLRDAESIPVLHHQRSPEPVTLLIDVLINPRLGSLAFPET
jgi:hypothetical protein